VREREREEEEDGSMFLEIGEVEEILKLRPGV
jgi:hypothetical protein